GHALRDRSLLLVVVHAPQVFLGLAELPLEVLPEGPGSRGLADVVRSGTPARREGEHARHRRDPPDRPSRAPHGCHASGFASKTISTFRVIRSRRGDGPRPTLAAARPSDPVRGAATVRSHPRGGTKVER